MADRVIEIIIDTSDKTGGKLESLKRSLLEVDAQAQKLHARFAALGSRAYNASIRLIDRVTAPGSKINALLHSLANKSYSLTMRLNDSVLSKVRSIEAGLMRLAGRAYTVAVNLKDNVSGKLKGITEGALMATGAGVLGAAGVGYGAVNALQSYMGFEKQMSAVQAVRELDKDSPEMVALTEQAKELGASTAWTRQEIGEAQYYEALAGWGAESILKTTPHIMNLASAGNAPLKATSDIVTDAMTAFQIKPTETFVDKSGRYVNAAEHFVDMLAKLQAISNTDILQAGESFKYGAANIGAMFADKDIQTRMQATQDAFVMTGLQANAGIKGSMSGTGIKEIFNRMGSMNMNAQRALEMLGVEYRDSRGDFLLPGDIMRQLSQRVKEGVSPEHLLNFAEEIAGEKIHAQTRRKLESFIEQTVANQGKIGSADLLKIMGMLGGSEHMGKLASVLLGDWDAMSEQLDMAHGTAAGMAKTQLENLAGSFTMLSSAWDAFQQSFFEGEAGSGLRSFVDSLTELVSRANKLFADGIELGDIGNLIAEAVDRLRNKFLALDGVGSVLAGGALIGGLLKIGSVAQKVMGSLKNLRGLQIGQRLSSSSALSAGQKIGTMTVTAGVVNVNGRVSGGKVNAASASPATPVLSPLTTAQNRLAREQKELARLQTRSDVALARAWSQPGNAQLQTRYRALQSQVAAAERSVARAQEQVVVAQSRQAAQVRTQSFVSDYYARKDQEQIAAQARAQRWSNMRSAAAGGGLFSGVFAALDVFNAKSLSAEMNSDVEKRLAAAQAEYHSLVANGAPAGQLKQQLAVVEGLRQEQAQIAVENQVRERETLAGASGSVIGAAIGAGLGSFLPGFGTMLGGIIGSVIGEHVGKKAATLETDEGESAIKNYFKDKYGGGSEKKEESAAVGTAGSWASFRESEDASRSWYLQHQRNPARLGEVAERNRQRRETAQNFAWADMELRSRGITHYQGQHYDTHPGLQRVRPAQESDMAQFDFGMNLMKNGGLQAAIDSALASVTATALPGAFTDMLTGGKVSSGLLDMLTSGKASAASLSEEQLMQQAAMEQPITEPLTQPDFSSFEQIFSDLESFSESVSEMFSGIGESINENLTTAFEGVGEVFSGFTESIGEQLTSAFDGLGDYFSEIGELFSTNLTTALESVSEIFVGFGEMIAENLMAAIEVAGEIFSGFGEMVTEALSSAQASAEGALAAIGASFTAAKDMIQSSWAELPGFFGGIFEGLGGVAASAGAAIASGLTSVIGSVIGAWQSAAATVSSIISSISAMASTAASFVPSIGGVGKAEGGFVTSETHFFAGEHGPEVIIPLSSSRRSRARDLLEKTQAILGGEAIPQGDYAQELPALDESVPILDATVPIMPEVSRSQSTQISLGGMDVSFAISGENPQEIMQAIRENLDDLADRIGGQLSRQITNCFGNMPLD